MKKWKYLLTLAVTVALLLAACGGPTTATESAAPDDLSSESSESMMDDEGEMMADDEGEMMDEEDEMMAEDEGEMMDDEESMSDDEVDEMAGDPMATTTFTVRIENTAAEGGLTVLAPGAYELNDHPLSFFAPGEADRGQGLEALAEDGDPSILAGTIDEMMGEPMAGFAVDVFNVPVGSDSPGPAGPGTAYEFTVEAYPGQYLTFATMYVQSNDWFFAPGPEGLSLFDEQGNPLQGEITDQISLWDAGTEVDQVPGEGADQAPRQAGPDTGEDENGVVSLVEDFDDYEIAVTVTAQ